MRRSIRRPAGSPTGLKAKIDAGAQFAQTQFCMDAGVLRRYAQRLAENGLDGFRLVIGLVPLRSAKLGELDQGEAVRARSCPTRS